MLQEKSQRLRLLLETQDARLWLISSESIGPWWCPMTKLKIIQSDPVGRHRRRLPADRHSRRLPADRDHLCLQKTYSVSLIAPLLKDSNRPTPMTKMITKCITRWLFLPFVLTTIRNRTTIETTNSDQKTDSRAQHLSSDLRSVSSYVLSWSQSGLVGYLWLRFHRSDFFGRHHKTAWLSHLHLPWCTGYLEVYIHLESLFNRSDNDVVSYRHPINDGNNILL